MEEERKDKNQKDLTKKALEKAFFEGYGYTQNQMDEVMDFIDEAFGREKNEGFILHEIESEHVHTDVVVAGDEDSTFIVSCGMGSREMPNCKVFVDKAFKNIEIFFELSKDYKLTDEDFFILGSELQRISKYPFANDTFFGPGHTISASNKFKERFGYDYFVFFLPVTELNVEDIGDVYFLPLIPIYAKERDWMVENNSFAWLYAVEDLDKAALVDIEREEFIP